MLKGYDKLHMLGRWAGKVDEGELNQLHAKGKINLEQVLPIGKKSITVGAFFSEYNAGIDENIVVSEEFKTNIRPPLERICIKRGWLLGDEAYVLSLLGEDVATKVSMLVGLKKSANLVLGACQQMMIQQNAKGGGKKPPQSGGNPHPEEPVDWHEPSDEDQHPKPE
jgi:hypothetical protein